MVSLEAPAMVTPQRAPCQTALGNPLPGIRVRLQSFRKQVERTALAAAFFSFPDKRELDVRTAAESDRLPNPYLSARMSRAEGETCRLPL